MAYIVMLYIVMTTLKLGLLAVNHEAPTRLTVLLLDG